MATIDVITKTPSNSQIIKILNQIIRRYNSLAGLYAYKGSVQTYNDLLAIQNPQIGDVYNVMQEDAEEGIAAGSNFAWNGTEWDNLGMGMDGLVKKINGFIPDDLGAVIFQYIKNITNNKGTLTVTIRNGESESNLVIETGKVKTVNGIEPDETGNISIEVPQPTIATQEEAEVGTDNIKFMTPLRVKQAISALAGDSSWTISQGTNGWARESSTGFTIQWGYGRDPRYKNGGHDEHSNVVVTLPRAFTAVYGIWAGNVGTVGKYCCYVWSITKTKFNMGGSNNSDGNALPYWWAVGIS